MKTTCKNKKHKHITTTMLICQHQTTYFFLHIVNSVIPWVICIGKFSQVTPPWTSFMAFSRTADRVEESLSPARGRQSTSNYIVNSDHGDVSSSSVTEGITGSNLLMLLCKSHNPTWQMDPATATNKVRKTTCFFQGAILKYRCSQAADSIRV